MIQRTEISSTHKQHALLSSTSPWLFAPLSNKQPRNLYQRVLKQQNEAIFLHLIMCVAGHQDYKDYLVKAWCRWLDGVGTTTKKFGNAEASERYLVYLGSSVFAALKFFFFFFFGILTRHLCACTVQDDCFFSSPSLSPSFLSNLFQRNTHYISAAWYPYTFPLE